MDTNSNNSETTFEIKEGQLLNGDQLKEMKYHYKVLKKAHRKANRKSAWPLTLLIIFLLIAIGGAGYALNQKMAKEKSDSKEEVQVIPVTQSVVSRSTIYTTYKGNGDVTAASSIDVYPDTPSGKVVSITVELGDYVEKDQILLWIDPSRPGQTYARSPVKAPVSGTVTKLNTSVGAMVSMQLPIVTLGDLRNLEVVAHIPEKYVSNVSLGQETRISLISWDDEYLTGKISEISPVVDPTSRTLRVKVDLQETDSRVRAGMFVRFSMVTETFENVLTLPSSAVVERFDDQFVYVIDGDKVVKRNILSGLSVNGISRIDEGLEEGEVVVVKGNNLLEDGSLIKIVEEME